MTTKLKIAGAVIALIATGAFITAAKLQSLHLAGNRADIDALPTSFGADNGQMRIESAGSIPVLVVNNLPFPTDYDRSSYPKQSLDGDWEFRVDPNDLGLIDSYFSPESKWPAKTQPVPGTYNATESEFRDYTGVAWYRRKFKLASNNAAIQRLCFRAVLLRASVWLNGQLLGSHEGGYLPFYFDTKQYIQSGENTLVVRVDNRLTSVSVPPKARENYRPGWAPYGGITRSVYLESLPENYCIKAAIDTVSIDKKAKTAKIKLQLAFAGSNKATPNVELTINDLETGQKFSFMANLTRENDYFWCEETKLIKNCLFYGYKTPNLYELTVKIDKTHFQSYKFGVRTVDLDNHHIRVNGERIFLRGLAKHEDHPKLGATQTKELIAQDWKLIEEMGANYMRLAHYPHCSDELIYARNRGVFLSEEVPLYHAGMGWIQWLWKGQWSGENPDPFPAAEMGIQQVGNPRLLLNSQQQLFEMIERDRNNPAILLWSVGNENFSLHPASARFHGWLARSAKAIDPHRLTTMAEWSIMNNTLDPLRHAADNVDVVSINMYPGWYFLEAEAAADILACARKTWPDKPILVSECGAGAAFGRTEADGIVHTGVSPKNKTFSEEYQQHVLSTIFSKVNARDDIAGFTPWVFADFYCPWFKENPVPGYNLKGVVSKDRERKKAYFKLQQLYRSLDRNRAKSQK